MRGRVAARKVLAVLAVAERAGLSRDQALKRAGLRPEDVADPDGRVPQDAWRDVWRFVVEATGDPDVGLAAAAEVDRGYFGVIDYAARSAATVREAVPLAARYFRLANTFGRLELTPLGDGLRVSRHVLGDEGMELPRQAAEFALATMVRVFRLAATPFALSAVRFRHPAPANDSRHRSFFGCLIHFGAPEDAVDLDATALSTPMRAPDPRLRALVESHATHLLANLEDEGEDLVTAVRHQLARRLSHGPLTLARCAQNLGLSERTLQRRLGEQNTSFRAILDALRSELGRRWIAGGLPPGEVAFLLGYSEVSAFYHAFQGWTGAAPVAWARAAADGAQGQGSGAPSQGRPGGSGLE